MQLRLDRDVFSTAVSYAARAVPARPVSPAHAGLLLETDGDRVRVSGFDPGLRVSAVMTLPAEVLQPGRLLLPGRMLSDIAAALPAGQVTLEAGAARVQVGAGNARFALPPLHLPDFPVLPPAPARCGAVDGAALAEAVTRVAFAAQSDSAVGALAGVHLELSGRTLTFVATDRYRLAVAQVPWRPDDRGGSRVVNVPGRPLVEAARSLARDGEVVLGVDATGSLALTSALRAASLGALDGEYPRWQALVPATATTTAVVGAREVAEALARVALVSDRHAPVRLGFADGELTIAAQDGQEASGSDVVPCQLRGKPLTMGVNPQLLREGLLPFGDAPVKIELTASTKPALLGPAEGTTYRYLVMPVRMLD